jgi:hypothetical protein
MVVTEEVQACKYDDDKWLVCNNTRSHDNGHTMTFYSFVLIGSPCHSPSILQCRLDMARLWREDSTGQVPA